MPLPPDVKLLPDNDATRLILPPRQRAGPRWTGCLPIAFGMVFAGFAVFWILGALGVLENPPPPPLPVGPEVPQPVPPQHTFDWSSILFALFGIPFVIAGCVPIALGILSFFPSHAEIIITAQEIISVNHIGPFRTRQRRALAEVGILRIGHPLENTTGAAAPLNHAIFAEAVMAEGEPAPPPLCLAKRYAVETLRPVAEYLVNELKRRGAESLHLAGPSSAPASASQAAASVTLTIDPEPVPAPAETSVEPSVESVPEEPALSQPEKSKIIFLPEAESLTFIVPRTGFRGTAIFFLLFSLVWDGLSFPFFAFMLLELIHEPSLENLGILAFLGIFVVIGIATLLAAIQFAYRKSVLLAARDSLVLTQTGPIRKSEFQWAATELTAIRSGNSNTTINGKILQELQILSSSKTNPSQSAFGGREDDELLWLADTLRRFYHVKAT